METDTLLVPEEIEDCYQEINLDCLHYCVQELYI